MPSDRLGLLPFSFLTLQVPLSPPFSSPEDGPGEDEQNPHAQEIFDSIVLHKFVADVLFE